MAEDRRYANPTKPGEPALTQFMPVMGTILPRGDRFQVTPRSPPQDELMTRGRREQCEGTLRPKPTTSPSADPGDGRGGDLVSEEYLCA